MNLKCVILVHDFFELVKLSDPAPHHVALPIAYIESLLIKNWINQILVLDRAPN